MPGRRWAATVTVMAVATAWAGCGGDDGSDVDLSTDDPGRTPVSGTTSEELAGYAEDEVTAYQEAVTAFQRNIRVGYDVYADGEATPAAHRDLETVFTGEALDYEWETLRDMEADGGHIAGTVTVVWTKPMRILVNDADGTVDLRACVDRRNVRVFQSETDDPVRSEVAKRAVFKTTLDRGSDGTWRVSGGEEIGTC